MFKKLLITFTIILSFLFNLSTAYTDDQYTVLRSVDVNTFNEYRYRITEQYIELRNKFEVNWVIDSVISNRILNLAKEWLNFLPDNLINTNYYNTLKTSVERGILFPENSSNFQNISTSIENYITKVNIQKVNGSVDAFPSSWNAPLTVSLRWNVTDPSWTKLENYNYTWWINDWWKRRVIWNRPSINYVFNEEWNYSVFLDVTSNHKNSKWFNDVLPFSSRADIEVKEKIASLILKVNWSTLWNLDELKFTPDDSRYWLLFDATSSTPTSWARFIRTEWDFGNWLKKVYDWSPRTERVVYASEGEYQVILKMTTNEWKTIERKFNLRINNPVATIASSQDSWFLGDNFTFTANSTSRNNNLTYSWRIIDIKNDKEIVSRNSSTFTHSFNEKWVYNVMLYVTEPSWQIDIDTKIVYINSRPPVANFTHTIPDSHRPNTVFLDATSSYDPDFSDDWKLKFSWIINWDRVNLDKPNFNWSNWFYTFSSVWEHSVVLEVTDPDQITDQKSSKVNISSILSVDFNIFPRVSQREKSIRFIADSPEAQFYEWDFWDGRKIWWKDNTISHTFLKSWIYNVKLKVVDSNDRSNTISKNVYIWDTDSPYAFISLKDQRANEVPFDNRACWNWAYIVNRVDTFSLSWSESLDITWENRGLSYSWKLWNSIYSSESFTRKFDELWCFTARLVVKSDKNWRESSAEINIKVENIKPSLSWLDVRIRDIETDPVIVDVTALWSEDRDWVIQSYLWYYYTDLDPEPQDFRATRNDSTSFVLPKITWNYYFVVVMKDNNESRSNSEEITWSRYFITLTWDNVNTPLVDLRVNNSSVWIWDEVIFTANAENILWQNLNSSVKFAWDFDWDWFYDMETTSNTVTHKYDSSWEKFARVKVSHKWFSNTKSLTVNVANILKPDFDYISIWNEFIFFDLSLWAWATYEWDMWDWNIVRKDWSFRYNYEDWNPVHLVKLKLTEWTKVREITKRVVRDMSNVIKVRQPWLTVFSNQKIDTESNTIFLKEKWEKVYLYLWVNNRDNVSYYVADFDIEYDSSMSWWNDDDEDNKNQNSYYSWDPIFITLNNFREQNVRVYTKWINWQIIESKDIKIVKEYIEDSSIDSSQIIFDWVSDSVRLKLERVKTEVDSFPREYKLKWLMYVQRLKDEWNDNREKTNIILEFSNFIDEINVPRWSEIIDILESLLIEWTADRSEKAIAFNALKNLLPLNIVCLDWTNLEIDWKTVTCYDLLVAKLEVIWENSNIDQNREIWKKILEVVAVDQTMTVREKNDFKAILNTFIYWWVSNIPEEEKQEVINNDKIIDWWNSFVDVILFILKIIFYIILLFSWIIILFFVYYKLVNKDKNKSFADFIWEKTWWKSSNTKSIDTDSDYLNDIFSEDIDTTNINDKIIDSKDDKKIDKVDNFKDPFSYDDDNNVTEKVFNPSKNLKLDSVVKENIVEEKKDDNKIDKNQESWVPDWLKWSFPTEPENKINESDVKENSEPIIFEEEKVDKIEPKEIKEVEQKKFTQIDEKPIKKVETSTKKIETWIPDWLKWSFTENVEDDSSEKNQEIKDIDKTKNEFLPVDKVVSDLDNNNIIQDEDKNIEDNNSKNKEIELIDEPELKKVDISEKNELSKNKKTTPAKKSIKTLSKDDFTFDIQKEWYEPKLETKEELDEFTKLELDDEPVSDIQIPDWLKWESTNSIKKEKKPVIKKEKKSQDQEKPDSKVVDKNATNEKQKTWDSELWDDWMKIPDWLKTDDDKK